MAKEKEKKSKEAQDKRVVYIGNSIKTPFIVINKGAVLLDMPRNYMEIVEKAPEIEKLFVPIDVFTKESKNFKNSNYLKDLTYKVSIKLMGGK